MKVRVFPEVAIFLLTLLGVLSLVIEAWHGPTPLPLVRSLQDRHLWNIWNELRWERMYSHEILHFLSGVVGSMLGCWIYFAIQKKRA